MGRLLVHHERDALSIQLRYSDVGLLIAGLVQFAANETSLSLQLKRAVCIAVSISIDGSIACAIVYDEDAQAHLEIARLQSRWVLEKFLNLHTAQIAPLLAENRSHLKFMEQEYTLSAALDIGDPDHCTMEQFLTFQHEFVSRAMEMTPSSLHQIQKQSGLLWNIVNTETGEFVLPLHTKWPPLRAVRRLIQYSARCLFLSTNTTSLVLKIPHIPKREQAVSFYLRIVSQTSFVWVATLHESDQPQRQSDGAISQGLVKREHTSDLNRLLESSGGSVSYHASILDEMPPYIESAYGEFVRTLTCDR